MYLREFQSYPGDSQRPQQILDGGIAEDRDESLYCFICGQHITSISLGMEIEGHHRHTFTNPGGFVFTIGCFRAASGCMDSGSYTRAHTWFPGTRWCFALCAVCGSHLGWTYQRPQAAHFYGLILKRLVSWREKRDFPGDN